MYLLWYIYGNRDWTSSEKRIFSRQSDTVAKILHKKLLSFMGISQVLLCIDITILIASGFVFGKKAVLYAIIMQMVYSKTISVVLFGFGLHW